MKTKICALLLGAAVFFSCATVGGDAATGGGGEGLSLDEAIARSAGDIAVKLPEGTRVAIVAFESPHGNLSGYIMDEIAGVLVNGSLEVADRNNLEYVYKELDFQMSGEVSDESAQSIGKFLGARYVITGQLVNLGGRYRYRLNGINVETAVHESSTRLDVRNDRGFERMLAALRDAAPVIRTAGYGAGKAPASAGTFLDRGIMFASRGEYDAAIGDFTQALTLDPDLQAAWTLRGRALVASVSQVTGVGDNFSGVDTAYTVGQAVSADRKAVYDRAIADFTQAIRLDPHNTKAYFERGRAYNDKGDTDRALADFNQAVRLNSRVAAAYNSRGLAYLNKRDYDKAITDFTEAIRLDPRYGIAYSNRGIAYSGKKDYDRAVADYTEAIRLDPRYASAYYNRGLAYYRKGDYDKAIADYTEAIRLDPRNAHAYVGRGNTYLNKRDYDKAITDFTEVIRLDSRFANMSYYNRGLAYYRKGDYDKAIADYTEAIRLDPRDASAYVNRGIVYSGKQDYDKAIADYTEALRINPNYERAKNNLEIARRRGN